MEISKKKKATFHTDSSLLSFHNLPSTSQDQVDNTSISDNDYNNIIKQSKQDDCKLFVDYKHSYTEIDNANTLKDAISGKINFTESKSIERRNTNKSKDSKRNRVFRSKSLHNVNSTNLIPKEYSSDYRNETFVLTNLNIETKSISNPEPAPFYCDDKKDVNNQNKVAFERDTECCLIENNNNSNIEEVTLKKGLIKQNHINLKNTREHINVKETTNNSEISDSELKTNFEANPNPNIGLSQDIENNTMDHHKEALVIQKLRLETEQLMLQKLSKIIKILERKCLEYK